MNLSIPICEHSILNKILATIDELFGLFSNILDTTHNVDMNCMSFLVPDTEWLKTEIIYLTVLTALSRAMLLGNLKGNPSWPLLPSGGVWAILGIPWPVDASVSPFPWPSCLGAHSSHFPPAHDCLCVQIPPSFCKKTSYIRLGPPYCHHSNLITSAKTLFSNKVTF